MTKVKLHSVARASVMQPLTTACGYAYQVGPMVAANDGDVPTCPECLAVLATQLQRATDAYQRAAAAYQLARADQQKILRSRRLDRAIETRDNLQVRRYGKG